eukprot:SM000048S16620  [mRNA]  locus=s48:780362:786549:- [translate_table: standard]
MSPFGSPTTSSFAQCECGHQSEDDISLVAHVLRCIEEGERSASHHPSIDAVDGSVREAGHQPAMEVPGTC